MQAFLVAVDRGVEVFFLRQPEALKLAAVASTWTDLVASHFRKLHITPNTPMSCTLREGKHKKPKEIVVYR